eukprot:COSAG03_NODE_645_length_6513_cov_2.546999_10_plen_219_part_00
MRKRVGGSAGKGSDLEHALGGEVEVEGAEVLLPPLVVLDVMPVVEVRHGAAARARLKRPRARACGGRGCIGGHLRLAVGLPLRVSLRGLRLQQLGDLRVNLSRLCVSALVGRGALPARTFQLSVCRVEWERERRAAHLREASATPRRERSRASSVAMLGSLVLPDHLSVCVCVCVHPVCLCAPGVSCACVSRCLDSLASLLLAGGDDNVPCSARRPAS